MIKPSFTRERKFDVTLPASLHDDIIADITKLLDDLVAGPFTSINPDAGKFKVDWLRKNLLSKYSDPTTTEPEVRRSAAISKWKQMEERNRNTNERLYSLERDLGSISSERLFTTASRFIVKMIGSRPDLALVTEGKFTNGASTRVKRGSTAIADKYTGKLHCTREAWPTFNGWIAESGPLWQTLFDEGICTPEYVESSDLFTVPKSTHIDRVACKEPEVNMFLQRGVGDYFRAKLKLNGCDLNDQSINRRLARIASRSSRCEKHRLATLDLSSASDLMSESLVYRLLPLEWVWYLDSIRVKSTRVDDEVHTLQMFSSMGNGFTFELESMIFLALARATAYLTGTKGTVSVYGDDIILPSSIVGIFTKVLQFCGLKVNKTKSFAKGFFRESCGGHYYGGNDVTPFYIRGRIDTLPQLILFLNQLRVWGADQDVGLTYESPELYRLWLKYASFVPRFLHGGVEVGSDFALMTNDRPRKRLSRIKGRRRASQLGALIYWLHRRSQEEDLFLETSYGTLEHGFSVSRNRSWHSGLPLNQLWWEET